MYYNIKGYMQCPACMRPNALGIGEVICKACQVLNEQKTSINTQRVNGNHHGLIKEPNKDEYDSLLRKVKGAREG